MGGRQWEDDESYQGSFELGFQAGLEIRLRWMAVMLEFSSTYFLAFRVQHGGQVAEDAKS